MATFSIPNTIPQVLASLEFDRGLSADDPRWVDTREARGAQATQDILGKQFGLFPSGEFVPTQSAHVLFFGHTGSGKSTELARYAHAFNQTKKVRVVEVNVSQELDENNLRPEDLAITMVKVLLEKVVTVGTTPTTVQVKAETLQALFDWTKERVSEETRAKELQAQIETGAKSGLTVPLVGSLFAKFTASFKQNVTYKETLRETVRNSYTQFISVFSTLIREVEAEITRLGVGERVVFFLDGTDKLTADDRKHLFVDSAAQLLQLPILALYTASVDLKYQPALNGTQWRMVTLPMIKLKTMDKQEFDAGPQAMRQLLLNRADLAMFKDEEVLKVLADASGGHVRDLVRLLRYACELVPQGNVISLDDARRAISKFASERAAFLEPSDYPILAKMDREPANVGTEPRVQELLRGLAALEYNDSSWRACHPALRELPGYVRAAAAL